MSLLKKIVKQHKRVIFGGDNYSAEWHEEAEKRGLPHLRDSVDSFASLKAKKNIDLFRKYGVLNKAEFDSRLHIGYEKYVKQLTIEAETMITLGRTMILPAALAHQTRVADTVANTESAGVKCNDTLGRAGRIRESGLPVPGSAGRVGEGYFASQRRSLQARARIRARCSRPWRTATDVDALEGQGVGGAVAASDLSDIALFGVDAKGAKGARARRRGRRFADPALLFPETLGAGRGSLRHD